MGFTFPLLNFQHQRRQSSHCLCFLHCTCGLRPFSTLKKHTSRADCSLHSFRTFGTRRMPLHCGSRLSHFEVFRARLLELPESLHFLLEISLSKCFSSLIVVQNSSVWSNERFAYATLARVIFRNVCISPAFFHRSLGCVLPVFLWLLDRLWPASSRLMIEEISSPWSSISGSSVSRY